MLNLCLGDWLLVTLLLNISLPDNRSMRHRRSAPRRLSRFVAPPEKKFTFNDPCQQEFCCSHYVNKLQNVPPSNVHQTCESKTCRMRYSIEHRSKLEHFTHKNNLFLHKNDLFLSLGRLPTVEKYLCLKDVYESKANFWAFKTLGTFSGLRFGRKIG